MSDRDEDVIHYMPAGPVPCQGESCAICEGVPDIIVPGTLTEEELEKFRELLAAGPLGGPIQIFHLTGSGRASCSGEACRICAHEVLVAETVRREEVLGHIVLDVARALGIAVAVTDTDGLPDTEAWDLAVLRKDINTNMAAQMASSHTKGI